MLSDVHIENTKNEADNTEDVDLHSPALEIEGIVQGEPDNNIVQSGDRYTQDDSTEKVLYFRCYLLCIFFTQSIHVGFVFCVSKCDVKSLFSVLSFIS